MEVSVMWQWYCIVQLLVLAVVRCEVHVVEWSIRGVERYVGDPLEVQLGDSLSEPDTLILMCVAGSYSNVIVQNTQEQFENCDATLPPTTGGDPVYMGVGECLGLPKNLSFEITRNSGALGSAFDFTAGSTNYLTSYSDGMSLSSALRNVTMGGECEDGLKLAINVVDPQVTTATPVTPSTSTSIPSQPPSQTTSQTTSQSSSTSSETTGSASTGTSTDAPSSLPSLPVLTPLGVSGASTLRALLATTAALVCTAVALIVK